MRLPSPSGHRQSEAILFDNSQLSKINYITASTGPGAQRRGVEPLSSLDERPFPKGALIAAGLLIFATIAGVGAIQLRKHFSPVAAVDGSDRALERRALRFVDAGDGVNAFGGHVMVYDAATDTQLGPLAESDGFIRAVLNSLAFERTKRGIDGTSVFQLVRWPDNKLTLEDSVTGAHVSLGAFGHGNRKVFLRFFDDRAVGS
jgi:putative photosynthetic complex assembly protein